MQRMQHFLTQRRKGGKVLKWQGNDCQGNKGYSVDDHSHDLFSGLPGASAPLRLCVKACLHKRSFSRVGRFAHPETGRDLACKAANYFERYAREGLNAKAQRNKDAKVLITDY